MNTKEKDYVGVKMYRETRDLLKVVAIKEKLPLLKYLDKIAKELSVSTK
jgi:hypothetical protein